MKIKKNCSCAATIHCAREHLSYCVAAHQRSLEGALTVGGKKKGKGKREEIEIAGYQWVKVNG
jgi:hypothetical protein